jgi:N-dimethylarginine dimethylaminohydrolase
MCRPTYFAVTYKINPWMDPSAPTHGSAINQWETLVSTYRGLGHELEFIDLPPELPDMVFAANGGTVIDGKMFTAQFRRGAGRRAPPRLGRTARPEVHEAKQVNEGEGDLLWSAITCWRAFASAPHTRRT